MQAIFQKLYESKRLFLDESQTLFSSIAKGELSHTQLALALICLKLRGETPEEIAGAARSFLAVVKPFPRPDYAFTDIVGTGGDGANTVNISTASALVAASCGVKVAKHGNRAVSSLTGSSDLLAKLGVNLNATPEVSRQMLDEHNICFLFAPQYHEGFKYAAKVRKELGTRTIFNVLGPLVNPARPPFTLIGVYNKRLVRPIAETLALLGYQRAIVVYGSGIDEVALHGKTTVAELRDGIISDYEITPQQVGFPCTPLSALRGGTPEENCQSLLTLLRGNAPQAHAHSVAMNVAMLLKLFGHDDIKQNAERALEAIHHGQALSLLNAITQPRGELR